VRPSSEPIFPKELKGRRPAALRLSGAARLQQHVTRHACYFCVTLWHVQFHSIFGSIVAVKAAAQQQYARCVCTSSL
jgi:hypothetical protein